MGAYTNPNGQTNSLEDIKVNLTTILDEIYTTASKTEVWKPSEGAIMEGFNGANTVRIPTISVDGLGDYDQAQGFRQGQTSVSYQEYTLEHDRSISFSLDRIDVREDGGVASAVNVMATLQREQVVPEIDASAISTVSTTALGVTDHFKSGYTPSKATMLTEIMNGLQVLEDDTAIDSGYQILINQKYAQNLKMSSEFSRNKDIESAGGSINNRVEAINGNPVTYVPSGRMYTAIDLNDGSTKYGYEKASTGADVIAVITAPNTAQKIVAHEVTSIFTPDVNQLADATKINYRVYYDTIIPKNKKKGLFVITA